MSLPDSPFSLVAHPWGLQSGEASAETKGKSQTRKMRRLLTKQEHRKEEYVVSADKKMKTTFQAPSMTKVHDRLQETEVQAGQAAEMVATDVAGKIGKGDGNITKKEKLVCATKTKFLVDTYNVLKAAMVCIRPGKKWGFVEIELLRSTLNWMIKCIGTQESEKRTSLRGCTFVVKQIKEFCFELRRSVITKGSEENPPPKMVFPKPKKGIMKVRRSNLKPVTTTADVKQIEITKDGYVEPNEDRKKYIINVINSENSKTWEDEYDDEASYPKSKSAGHVSYPEDETVMYSFIPKTKLRVQKKKHGSYPACLHRLFNGICSTDETRLQAARMARALPVMVDEVEERKALEKHKATLSKPLDWDQELADEIYYFGQRMMRLISKDIRDKVSWEPREGSASLNFSRTEGGRFAELLEDSKEVLSPLLEFVPDFEGSEILDDVIVETAIEIARTRPFVAKVMAVKEEGYKVRVLSKFPASFMLPADIIRRQFDALLMTQPWMDNDIIPNQSKIQQALKASVHTSGQVVSADLSTATDNLCIQYAQALWMGLISELAHPSWVEEYLMKMFSEHELEYPDGFRIKQKRGVHMGTPLSFQTLCLMHRFCVERAGLERNPHVIRGDDMLGVFDDSESYFREMQRVGFIINKEKTIISSTGGIFAEVVYRFERAPIISRFQPIRTIWSWLGGRQAMQIASVRRFYDIPLKGILHASIRRGPNETLRTLGSVVAMVRRMGTDFEGWSLGKDQGGPSKGVRGMMKKMHHVIFSVHNKLISSACMYSIPVNAPLEFGGCGIPDERGNLSFRHTTFKFRAMIGKACSNERAARRFNANVRHLEARTDLVFGRLWLTQTRDVSKSKTSISRGAMEYTFEPFSTDAYKGSKRRWAMYQLLGGTGKTQTIRARARRMLSETKPPSMFKWMKTVSSGIGAVRPRWAVNKKADEEHLFRLVQRLKSAEGVYVPAYDGGKASLISQFQEPSEEDSWMFGTRVAQEQHAA